MTTTLRRTAALVAALVCGLALVLVGTATADDRDDEDCAFGTANGKGTVVVPGAGAPFADVEFTLCRTGPKTSDVTGDFKAVPSPTAGLIEAQGPITCADFADNVVSFIYPLDERSKPAQAAFTEILFVATDGGPNGAGDQGAFVGPVPRGGFGDNCDVDSPQGTAGKATSLPLGDGDFTVESAKR